MSLYKSQFVEQMKNESSIISRGRNYTHRSGALRLYTHISKGASECRMLLCSLLDQLFLKNPPVRRAVFFIGSGSQSLLLPPSIPLEISRHCYVWPL